MTPGHEAIVILASGLSRRFGEENKLLAHVGGRPLADYCAQAAIEYRAQKCFAIVPQGNAALAALFTKRGIEIIENTAPEAGMGASLALGVKVCARYDRLFVLLADMPRVGYAHLKKLSDALGVADAAFACVDDHISPPALFSRRAFPRLLELDGDAGARVIIDELGAVVSVTVDRGTLIDIDYPSDISS
ncbi:MAG: nucleotidyltransferase family protein [Pseudomonadota bacterium]